MIQTVRACVRLASDLVLYAIRSGRWWMPIVMLVLIVGAAAATTATAVLPTAMYTLF